VLQTLLPKIAYLMIGLVLVTMMLALIAEALRRELSAGPTPWAWIVAVVFGNAVLLVFVQHILGDHRMRVVQLAIVSALDLGCCYLLFKVIRAKRSRALSLVLVGFLVVVITNLFRIHGYLARGEAPVLLTFTTISNLGFIANYLAVVIYSFGYWGSMWRRSGSWAGAPFCCSTPALAWACRASPMVYRWFTGGSRWCFRPRTGWCCPRSCLPSCSTSWLLWAAK
jgi:hypothetical protein